MHDMTEYRPTWRDVGYIVLLYALLAILQVILAVTVGQLWVMLIAGLLAGAAWTGVLLSFARIIYWRGYTAGAVRTSEQYDQSFGTDDDDDDDGFED